MIGRIVEISGLDRHLCVDRGFLVVKSGKEVIGRVPIDDISGVICNSYSLTYSNNLLVALAERCCPVVICGRNHKPTAMLWSTECHHRQSDRLDKQILLSLPRKKRLWKLIIKSKLSMQAEVLELCGRTGAPLRAMVRKVRSGDSTNVEGQGSRTYWSLLFGKDFRRNPDQPGTNSLLNYGYAVLRSVVARHVMGHGLHPGIGLHHSNDGNALRLVDDLMEPFRPVVDAWVFRLLQRGQEDICKESKEALALLPTRSMMTSEGVSPVTLVVQRLCSSFVNVISGLAGGLKLPGDKPNALTAIWDEAQVIHETAEEEACA
jgi:CRISPR-associated protein Cas1